MYHSYPVQKENYSIIERLHVIEGDPSYPEFALNIKKVLADKMGSSGIPVVSSSTVVPQLVRGIQEFAATDGSRGQAAGRRGSMRLCGSMQHNSPREFRKSHKMYCFFMLSGDK